jgi:hypothetical protein
MAPGYDGLRCLKDRVVLGTKALAAVPDGQIPQPQHHSVALSDTLYTCVPCIKGSL